MKEIKILVVDDSAFMRRVISEMLSEQADFRVIAAARDGKDAMMKIAQFNPDVVTLDVEMPGNCGLSTLKKIMAETPLPVIMLSSHTQAGSSITMEALSLGAFDFVAKPALSRSIKEVNKELTQKIRAASKANRMLSNEQKQQYSRKVSMLAADKNCRLLAIGASTGGPSALEKVLIKLPAGFPVPIVITQHMPAGFTKAFADRLNNLCRIVVKEGQDGDILEKGTAYVAPGGYHMTVNSYGRITLNQDPPVEYVRPSVNVMLSSAINVYEENIIGVILTGMGKDGADAMADLKNIGGRTIVQDESTSVIFSMPKAVIDRNAADVVAPIYDIPRVLLQLIN